MTSCPLAGNGAVTNLRSPIETPPQTKRKGEA